MSRLVMIRKFSNFSFAAIILIFPEGVVACKRVCVGFVVSSNPVFK